MSTSNTFFRQLVAAGLVAIGIAAFWCAATNWVIETAKNAIQGRQPYENICVTRLGEPVIVRSQSGNTQNADQIVSLDGRAVSVTSQDLLYLNSLDSQSHHYYSSIGLEWTMRVAGINDGGVPPIYWYLVHDGQTPGHAYGVGYSASARTVRGYFGRRGFTDSLPPRDDWFEVNGASGLRGLVSTYGFGQEPRYSTGIPSFLFLADGKLLKIDLAKKQIDTLLDCPLAFCVGQAYRLRDPQSIRSAIATGEAASVATPLDGIVREPASLIIVNQKTSEHTSYPIPESMRDKMLGTAILPSGELLVTVSDNWRDGKGTVVWLTPSGEIAKEQPVQLQSRYNTSTSWRAAAWQMAVSAPYPVASAAFTFLIAPSGVIQEEKAQTYAECLAVTLPKTWPGALAVLVVSIVAAVFAYRRQRAFGLPHAAAWAGFAFVLGLPGWLAYRFHRPWPVLEECPACHQPAPRDREQCLDCGASFPQPKLKGIEVFA